MNTQETAHLLTLNEASKQFGRSKGTLSKAISRNELSVKSKKGNSFQLDPAEVDRWCKAFPLKKPTTSSENRLETPENTSEINELKVELERIREQLNSKTEKTELLSDQIEDLKAQRDKWEQQATSQTLLLTHEQERSQAGFFKKLFGAG